MLLDKEVKKRRREEERKRERTCESREKKHDVCQVSITVNDWKVERLLSVNRIREKVARGRRGGGGEE